jgi:hypothetical protein
MPRHTCFWVSVSTNYKTLRTLSTLSKSLHDRPEEPYDLPEHGDLLGRTFPDSTNARLAKEKFLKHDELYARTGGLRDPAVEAQRSALRSMLQLDSP